MTLLHIVGIKPHDTTTKDEVAQAVTMLEQLGDACGGEEHGILGFEVLQNLDTRKGYALVELAFFRDDDALQAFRVHPAHVKFVNFLATIADWVVLDCHPQTKPFKPA
ncbi:MAG: Dabb family protein [Patescibacteria group bacterium]